MYKFGYNLILDEPEHLPFDPPTTCEVEYPITTYQPKYFVTESFDDAKHKLKEFAKVRTCVKINIIPISDHQKTSERSIQPVQSVY